MCELRREGPPSHHLRAVGCGANALAMQGTGQQICITFVLTSLDTMPRRRPRLPRTNVNSLICAMPVLMIKVLQPC